MANVTIDIASEFRGKPAFDKAGKSVSSLEKAVGKLGKQLIGVFAARKLYAFGKESVKAFAADEAAAMQLSKAVENLGLAFAAPSVENYVQTLQAATGVIDDELRPAMQGLLTSTGSVVQSQKLLAQAIDISRGSGVDLVTVANDLAQAYVGNIKGLRKYNLGLTQAELKASSFADIQQKLNNQFSGASAAYLTTYAGKMEKLNTAFSNAKENIGKGILDGLTALGGSGATNIDTATSAMNDFSIKIGNAAYGLGILIDKLGGDGKSPKWLDKLTSIVTFGAGGAIFDKLASMGAKATAQKSQGFSFFGSPMEQVQKKRDAVAAVAAEAAAKKRAQELANATKKNTAELKKQAALKKAGSIFDMEQIQIVAALKGKLSDEERKRVELQLALITENTTEAQKLTYEIAKAQGLGEQMARNLASLPAAKNPFEAWAAYLDIIAEKAKAIANMSFSAGNGSPNPNNFVFPDPTASLSEANRERGNFYGSGNQGVQNVTIAIDGKAIADAVVGQAMNGNNAYLNRRLNGCD